MAELHLDFCTCNLSIPRKSKPTKLCRFGRIGNPESMDHPKDHSSILYLVLDSQGIETNEILLIPQELHLLKNQNN